MEISNIQISVSTAEDCDLSWVGLEIVMRVIHIQKATEAKRVNEMTQNTTH